MGMALLRMRAAALAALAWGSACGGNVVVDGMPDGSGGAGATSSSAISSGAFGSSAVSTGAVAVSAGVGGSGVGGSTGVTVGVGGSTAVGTGGGGIGGSGSSAVSTSAVSTSATWMATSGTASASSGAGGGEAWSACVRFCERYAEACGASEPGGCGTTCDTELAQAPQCNDLLIPFFDCLMNGRFDCDVVGPRCQRFLDEYDACANGDGCPGIECAGDRDRACRLQGSVPGHGRRGRVPRAGRWQDRLLLLRQR